MIDVNTFRRNQSQVPRQELEKFNGKYVAWSPDGTSILAGDLDAARLDVMIREAGFDPAEILVTLVAIPEEIAWSGWSMQEGVDPL